ncbi:hypothetical protein BRD17_09870 [Halobacteriales archaeon SW_7_68_16]|nr:MAG: hypothetical protein BRD17_09870 [Halobacteriales archaeon SW_7_68_16]
MISVVLRFFNPDMDSLPSILTNVAVLSAVAVSIVLGIWFGLGAALPALGIDVGLRRLAVPGVIFTVAASEVLLLVLGRSAVTEVAD